MHRGLQNAAFSAAALVRHPPPRLGPVGRRARAGRRLGVRAGPLPQRQDHRRGVGLRPARAALPPARPDARPRRPRRRRAALRVAAPGRGRVAPSSCGSPSSVIAPGSPIDTIKHYLRIGVLPRGRPIADRRSEYDETHVERLRLIRAMARDRRHAGWTPCAGCSTPSTSRADQPARRPRPGSTTSCRGGSLEDHEPTAGSLATVDGVIARQDWHIGRGQRPPRRARGQPGRPRPGGQLGRRRPPRLLRPDGGPDRGLRDRPTSTRAAAATRRSAVLRSARALYEPLIVLLRRLAQEHASRDWAAEASWLPTRAATGGRPGRRC